jgi:hypothetical protein
MLAARRPSDGIIVRRKAEAHQRLLIVAAEHRPAELQRRLTRAPNRRNSFGALLGARATLAKCVSSSRQPQAGSVTCRCPVRPARAGPGAGTGSPRRGGRRGHVPPTSGSAPAKSAAVVAVRLLSARRTTPSNAGGT